MSRRRRAAAGNVRDSHADMQIVEHAGHVFGTVVALVLEYGEVVVAVGQVVADSSLASDLKPQTISPEADRLGEIGRSYSLHGSRRSFFCLLTLAL